MRVVSEVLTCQPQGKQGCPTPSVLTDFFLTLQGHLPSLFHSFHPCCGPVLSQFPSFPSFQSPTEQQKDCVPLPYSSCLIPMTHLAPQVLHSHLTPFFFRSPLRTSLFISPLLNVQPHKSQSCPCFYNNFPVPLKIDPTRLLPGKHLLCNSTAVPQAGYLASPGQGYKFILGSSARGRHFRAVGARRDCKTFAELMQNVNLKLFHYTLVRTHLQKLN